MNPSTMHIPLEWAAAPVATAGALSLGLAGWSAVARRPQVDRTPPRDLLILAAHQDDCAILAGERAIEAIKAGRTVRICYLTCGAESPDRERSRTRRHEAIDAWGSVGVPADAITFLDSPQSDVRGPSAISDAELARCRHELVELVRALPDQAAVVFPAAGEFHTDHRTLRAVALGVLRESERPDLLAIEAAEYNQYFSLLHAPGRVIAYVLRQLPLGSRLVSPWRARHSRFAYGPRAWRLPPDSARLEMKRALLRQFPSENGELLARAFGGPDEFRPVADLTRDGEDGVTMYLRVGERYLAPSVFVVWAFVWGSAFTAAAAVAAALPLAALLVIVAGYLVWRAREVERRIAYLAAAVGLVAGAWPTLV